MVPSKLSQVDPLPPKKYDSDHPMLVQLEKLLVEGITFKQDNHYMPMAKNALMLIFQLGESPDKFSAQIVRKVCEKIKNNQEEIDEEIKVETFVLSRYTLDSFIDLLIINVG